MKNHSLWALAALVVLAVVFAFDAQAGNALLIIGPALAVTLEDLPELAETLKSVAEKHAKSVDEVKALATDVSGRIAKGEQVTEGLKTQADDWLTKMNGFTAQIEAIEQKMARRGANDSDLEKAKSLGRQFVETEGFKNLAAMPLPRGRADMQVKATITLAVTDADGSAGDLVQTQRIQGVQLLPDRRMTVRDLLTPGQMDGNALEYVKETGFTNAAAATAEGLAKPQSNLKYDLVSTTAKVIAHYVKASRQILSDSSQLATMIDGRLRYGLAYVEETQLLNGDGTGQNLLGIIPQASAYVAPFDPAGTETSIDFIRLAMLQATLARYPSTGTVLHPSEWARIELLKDTTGRYIIGNPQGTLSPTLWGLPVVETQAIAVDKFLTGAFKLGAQLFDRWLARVEVATENEDDFIKNLVTILAEERLALAVYRPEAFIYGDFGFVV